MLTKLLLSRTPIAALLAFVAASAMLIGSYMLVDVGDRPDQFLFLHWAFKWLKQWPAALPVLCILTVIASILLGRLRFRELRSTLADVNLSTVILVAVLATQQNVLFQRPDILVAHLIILSLFMLLFYTYKQESAYSAIFHAGLLLGLATLFAGQCIGLLISVAVALYILRTGSWKEWLVLLLGLFMAAVFIALFVVWAESPLGSFQYVLRSAWIAQTTMGSFSVGHMALLFVLALSLSGMLRDLTLETVHVRNIVLVNLSWLIGVLLLALFFDLQWQAAMVLAAFPVSTIIARNLQKVERWWLADLILLLVLLAPFLSNRWPF